MVKDHLEFLMFYQCQQVVLPLHQGELRTIQYFGSLSHNNKHQIYVQELH